MIEGYIGKVRDYLSSGKAVKLAVLLGIAGVIIIFASGLTPKEKKDIASDGSSDIESYISCAAASMEEVVRSITGEKSPVVYITAESGTERIYAAEEKTKGDSAEETFVIIKDSDGNQSGLLLNENQPIIRGVVVVSSGADDPVAKEKIISAVRTAFDIPSNKVCVVSKYN